METNKAAGLGPAAWVITSVMGSGRQLTRLVGLFPGELGVAEVAA